MSDFLRLTYKSGSLASTPIHDFWSPTRTAKDPQIPNLPLETPTGGGVTVALTGVAGASAVGTVLPQTAVLATGVGAAGSVGALVVAAGDVTVALTGVAGTAAVGTVLAQTAAPVTGVAGTAAVGALTPATTTALTGAAGTTGQGTVAPVTAAPATGVGGSLGQGVLAPSSTVTLAGVVGTGATGSVSVYGGDVTVALSGVSAVGVLGVLLPVASSGAASGVTRQWLVDYYTRAFERKPAEPAAARVPKATQRPTLKPLPVGEYPSTLKQVEELARRRSHPQSRPARSGACGRRGNRHPSSTLRGRIPLTCDGLRALVGAARGGGRHPAATGRRR
jgi:hypothetical protein